MCGACPIPAGSGKANRRHRLNRGGNRQANAALYGAIIVRTRWHQPTIDYVTRRTAEWLSKREIIRGLERYLARKIYTYSRRRTPWSRQASEHEIRSTDRLAQYRCINATAETFSWLFKAECIRNPVLRPKGGWNCVGDVEIAVGEYIDRFNHRRLHGEIGLVPPAEFETNHWASTEVQNYPEIPVLTEAVSG